MRGVAVGTVRPRPARKDIKLAEGAMSSSVGCLLDLALKLPRFPMTGCGFACRVSPDPCASRCRRSLSQSYTTLVVVPLVGLAPGGYGVHPHCSGSRPIRDPKRVQDITSGFFWTLDLVWVQHVLSPCHPEFASVQVTSGNGASSCWCNWRGRLLEAFIFLVLVFFI